jgi:hypothetical protein
MGALENLLRARRLQADRQLLIDSKLSVRCCDSASVGYRSSTVDP